jgi:hypothetical protein
MKRLIVFIRTRRLAVHERGFTTAELLGNAALGVAALVVIWLALQLLGQNVVDWIRAQLKI